MEGSRTIDSKGRFERRVAAGVIERHESRCGLSRGLKRAACTCEPSFLARTTDANGERRWQTFANLAEAVAWVARTKSRSGGAAKAVAVVRPAEAATVAKPAEAPTLEQAARWFLERAVAGSLVNRSGQRYSVATLKSYETQLRRRVLPFVEPRSGRQMADLRVDEITRRSAQALANELAATASAATTRTAIAALQSVMREAYEAGLSEAEPPGRLRMPSPPKPRQRVLREAEVAGLLEAAATDDARLGRSFAYPLLRLLSQSGARVGEVLALSWGSGGIDLASSPPVMRIGASKTDAGIRDVWLDAETADALRAHHRASGKPKAGTLVFTRSDGSASDRFGIARATVGRVARAAGVPGVTPHVFRHTHVTRLVADGASIVDIAARVGHADPRHTLSLYAKPTDEGQARILKLLEGS